MSRPSWFPDWSGETCIIVASGPSARSVNLEIARGRTKAIAVNSSGLETARLRAMGYDCDELCPWADVLFGSDYAFWEKAKGAPEFRGLKVTLNGRAARNQDWSINRVLASNHAGRLETRRPGHIAGGGSSGFGAINLAVVFGAKRLILVGFDMRLDYGVHWHGDHPQGMGNPRENNIGIWRTAIDRAAKELKAAGVEVLNASQISTLKEYPLTTLEDALCATC